MSDSNNSSQTSFQSDEHTREELTSLLSTISSIALVGASPKAIRPSYKVMEFLLAKGFKVIPVNPGLSGQILMNEKIIGSLSELSQPVDMVEIFRNSEAAGEVCEEVLQQPKELQPKLVWMQIGVVNELAARKLREQGIKVVMNQCPKKILEA